MGLGSSYTYGVMEVKTRTIITLISMVRRVGAVKKKMVHMWPRWREEYLLVGFWFINPCPEIRGSSKDLEASNVRCVISQVGLGKVDDKTRQQSSRMRPPRCHHICEQAVCRGDGRLEESNDSQVWAEVRRVVGHEETQDFVSDSGFVGNLED
jgi:hypothetical protein